MTQRAGRLPAVVATACPAGRPPPYWPARNSRQAARIAGPPLRWIAPSTPPPPSSDELAALTIASTRCAVMSPSTRFTLMSLILLPEDPAGQQGRAGHRARHHQDGGERDQEDQEHRYPEA